MARLPPFAVLPLLTALLAPALARAGVEAALAARPDGAALRALWLEGRQLERDGDLAASAERFEGLVQGLPGEPEAHWRFARVQWRRGERMAPAQREPRLALFRRAEALARRGLELDPRCAPCMFWLAASLGRISTTQGVVESARLVPVIGDLLARAIALEPTERDSSDDTVLGNLYHFSAAFHRLVPDWFWLSWMLGVRGDKERSVEHSRIAVAISPGRVDYQVELGAGLLCLGTSRGRPDLVEEGLAVLQLGLTLAAFEEVRLDPLYARALIAQPERACTYARDGWIEIDERDVRGAEVTVGSR